MFEFKKVNFYIVITIDYFFQSFIERPADSTTSITSGETSTTSGQASTASGLTSTMSGQASTTSDQTSCASTTNDKTSFAIIITKY